MSEPFIAEPVEQELEEEDQAFSDKAEEVPDVRDDTETNVDETEQGFSDGLTKLQQHYGSSDFEVGENIAFRLLEQADGTFLIDYGNGFEPVTGDDTTSELLQDGPVVKVDAQGNGGTVFMRQGSTPTAAGTVHHIASQGFRYVGERPNGIDDEPTADGEPEGRETVSSHSNNAEIIPLSPQKKTAWFDKFFDEQAIQEQAISFLPLNENVVDHQEAADKITELFPSTVTAISPQATEVKSLGTVFQEVAAAPVGTQVVIPGELVPDEFEGANQVIRDAMVVKRLDTGVSISFVEGVVNNPSPPFLVQSPPRLWPASQPLPSVAAKAMAVESLRPAAIEVSSPVHIETVRATTPNQVEENGYILNPTWLLNTQPAANRNEQPSSAIEGLPLATRHENVPFTNSPKPILAESIIIPEVIVSHTPDVPSLSVWSEPQSPVEKMPINTLENVTDRALEGLPEQPIAAKQTPGVGFVRMVETRSAQFVDASSLKTNDPVLPKSRTDSSVVFDQAPPQREKRDDLTNITTTISGIRESAAAKRVQQEAASGVQHEPSFQLPPRHNIQNNITLQTTIPRDRPAVVSSPERVGSKPSRVRTEEPRFGKKEDVVFVAAEAKQGKHHNAAPLIEGASPAQSPEPVYLFAPLITSAPNKPRHVIRIEATNTDEAEQPLLVTPDTRPELVSEIRRRVGSPGSQGNRAAQIVAIPPARAATQASI